MFRRLRAHNGPWDAIVVGGGATGAGVAIDAASRGYDVLLLEQSDFGKGTSSRSTKLVHGGVRYLEQGNVTLVMEALKERGILRRNAPHLVDDVPFVVPNYSWWEAPFYGIGLKIYDLLAGKYGFGKSEILSREDTLERIPTLRQDGLPSALSHWQPWVLISLGIAGILLSTGAYQASALSASLPVIDTVEPVSGVIIGAVLFDERVAASPGGMLVQVGAGVVAAVGIAMLGPSLAAVQEGPRSVLADPGGPTELRDRKSVV